MSSPVPPACHPRAGDRAVVLGASIAGLLAARVLREQFAHVTLVERDVLPVSAIARKGTPQAVHPHGLLARGREVIESLFPGLCETLVAQGALMGRRPEEVLMMAGGIRFATASRAVEGIAVSRLALEAEVRRRVLALPGVVLRDGVRDAEPVFDRSAGAVRAVQLTAADGVAESLPADLVVDCTGRGSRAPGWLERWGFAPAEEERVDVRLRYTSAYFERDARTAGLPIAIICSATPQLPRAAVMLAQEPADAAVGRWVIATGGYADDQPERTLDDLRRRARSVGCAEMVQVAEQAPLLGEVLAYNFPYSVRRRYERLARFPAGFLVMGDALTSFNPIYGQGMTTAACESLALRDALAGGATGLHRRFFQAASRIIDTPWQLAVGADLALPCVPGRRSARVRAVNRYVSWVRAAAEHDGEVAHAFARVVHLLASPESLFAPEILARVTLRGARRPWKRTPAGGGSADRAASRDPLPTPGRAVAHRQPAERT